MRCDAISVELGEIVGLDGDVVVLWLGRRGGVVGVVVRGRERLDEWCEGATVGVGEVEG